MPAAHIRRNVVQHAHEEPGPRVAAAACRRARGRTAVGRRLLAAILVALCCLACGSRAPAPVEPPVDTCDPSQWNQGDVGEEFANPGQAVLVPYPRRTAVGCSMRFSLRDDPRDLWNGRDFRALRARYDSQEGWGDTRDVVYAFSIYFPVEGGQTRLPTYTLVWELHQRRNLYDVSPSLGLAPHAIELLPDGRLVYRLEAGPANWWRGRWTGWSTSRAANTLVSHVATGTWYDVTVRLRFSEGEDGLTQVYARRADRPWPHRATVSLRGPNLPWVPGGLDPAVPDRISSRQPEEGTGYRGLYLEAGLYPAGDTWSRQGTSEIISYMSEVRRYPRLQAALLSFPAPGG